MARRRGRIIRRGQHKMLVEAIASAEPEPNGFASALDLSRDDLAYLFRDDSATRKWERGLQKRSSD